MPQHVLQLRDGVARIQRNDDRAELGGREHGDHEFRPVRHVDRHAVAGLDPELGQGGGQRGRAAIHLGIRQPFVSIDEEDAVRPLTSLRLQYLRD